MNAGTVCRLAAGALLVAAPVAAQQAPSNAGPLAVGTVAPDFVLPGATQEGLTAEPIRLSAFRDQTVVIAFFYQARTKG
ncbi:MAG: hypothetical protein ACREL2_03140 [Gemmatimonadales bacterium]